MKREKKIGDHHQQISRETPVKYSNIFRIFEHSFLPLILDVAGLRKLHRSAIRCEKWQLVSAVCLERYPVISAEPNDLEKRYADLLHKTEFENSLESDHELRHREDL